MSRIVTASFQPVALPVRSANLATSTLLTIHVLCFANVFLMGLNVSENEGGNSSFSFFSSFQSTLISEGLSNQVGWGHVWNRFAGPLSCGNQTSQCAYTPLLSPAWWDGLWQSPTQRDIRRMEAYGVRLSGFGTVDEDVLLSFCTSKKEVKKFVTLV